MNIKNRGAITNPAGRFETKITEAFYDDWYLEENLPDLETTLFLEKAKTIITRNDSPDIGFEQSINPYKGCEHGCILTEIGFSRRRKTNTWREFINNK